MAKESDEVKDKVKETTDKAQTVRSLELPQALSVRQLAEMIGVSAIDVIKQLMREGVLANINQVIDYDIASEVARNYGFKSEKQAITTKGLAAKKKQEQEKKKTALQKMRIEQLAELKKFAADNGLSEAETAALLGTAPAATVSPGDLDDEPKPHSKDGKNEQAQTKSPAKN